jgi:hypothetical protein
MTCELTTAPLGIKAPKILFNVPTVDHRAVYRVSIVREMHSPMLLARAHSGELKSRKLIHAIADYVKAPKQCVCCDCQFSDANYPDAFIVISDDGAGVGITAGVCRVCSDVHDDSALQKIASGLLQTLWPNVRAINPANFSVDGGRA